MDEDLKTLYKYAMGGLMKLEAKKYGCFFAQEEFEKNMGKIFIIKRAFEKLEKKLDERKSN